MEYKNLIGGAITDKISVYKASVKRFEQYVAQRSLF